MSDVMFGFGAMRLDLEDENDESSVNFNDFAEMIDYYMNQGFNYFDTSYAYHNGASEVGLREGLVKRYPRDSFKIADKIPTWALTSEEDNQKFVDIMLERLGTDFFDVLLIHNINETFLQIAENSNSFDYIKKMKEEGIAKKIGISYHDRADLLEEILLKYGDAIDVVQLQLNYLDWESKLTESRKNYEICEKFGKDVIVMEPIKGGTLYNLPDDIKVLSGVGNLEQMKENCEVFKPFEPMSEEEEKFVLEMANEIKELIAIDCSYCGYCLKECPAGIPIPDFFELYNSEKMYSLPSLHAIYGTTAAANAPASACTECESCLAICTQKLDIPTLLKDVVNTFE